MGLSCAVFISCMVGSIIADANELTLFLTPIIGQRHGLVQSHPSSVVRQCPSVELTRACTTRHAQLLTQSPAANTASRKHRHDRGRRACLRLEQGIFLVQNARFRGKYKNNNRTGDEKCEEESCVVCSPETMPELRLQMNFCSFGSRSAEKTLGRIPFFAWTRQKNSIQTWERFFSGEVFLFR